MQQLYEQMELDRENIFFDLRDMLAKHNATKVFVVSGGTWKRTYLPDYLEALGVELTHFSGFSPNPKYEEVCAGVDLFRSNGCEFVIAVGGGSAMDVAKAIKLYAKMSPGSDYMKEEIVASDIPFLAVPTTAGTGSDGNGNIVFYRDGVKQSLNHPSVVPDYVLFEPKFLVSLPEYQKKATLADAMCQCIESIWSKGATEESTGYATEGLRLLYENALKYLRGEISSYPSIQRGAYLSGRAINISKTTAAHALSYKLSSELGIAHGHAVLMLLSPVCRSIEDHLILECGFGSRNVLRPDFEGRKAELTDDEIQAIVDGPRYYIDENDEKQEVPESVRELMEKLATIMSIITPGKKRIRHLHKQITFIERIIAIDPPEYPGEEKLREMASMVNPERLGNNPVSYTEEELVDIYLRAFHKVRVRTMLDLYDRNPERWSKAKAEFTEKYKDDLSPDRIVDDPFHLKIMERQEFVSGLQKLTLETLLLTQKFLDEQGLRFYLSEGTLMGAVRHHGFIPWDDDVDIMMPREDYNKLVELDAQGLIPPELHFDSLENNPKHWVLGAKMQLTRKTNYIQKPVESLSEYCGPYVDIFPLDYWIDRFSKPAYKADKIVKSCRRMLFMKTGYSRVLKGKWKRYVALLALPFIKNEWIEKIAIKNMTKWQKSKKKKFMVNLCSYYPFFKEIFPISFYGEPEYIPFEGHLFPVPREYDFMLRNIYGNKYDSIPPVEVTNLRKHAFELSTDERPEEAGTPDVGNTDGTEDYSDERYDDGSRQEEPDNE